MIAKDLGFAERHLQKARATQRDNSLTDCNVAFENLMTPENGELGKTWQSE